MIGAGMVNTRLMGPKFTARKMNNNPPGYRVWFDDGTGELEIGSLAERQRPTTCGSSAASGTLIEREAVAPPLDHAIGFELADNNSRQAHAQAAPFRCQGPSAAILEWPTAP